jgi:hypothetical protein
MRDNRALNQRYGKDKFFDISVDYRDRLLLDQFTANV